MGTSGHKRMARGQFVDGMMRLIYGSQFHRDVQNLVAVHRSRRDVIALRKEMRAMHLGMNHLHTQLAQLEDLIQQIKAKKKAKEAPAVLHTKEVQDDVARTWEDLRSTIHA